jgi:hypothetical protein
MNNKIHITDISIVVKMRSRSETRTQQLAFCIAARVFSEFRRYGIPYVFFNSVYSVHYTEFRGIPQLLV